MAILKNLAKATAITALLATSSLINIASAASLSDVPSGSYSVDPTHAFINLQYSHLGLSHPTLSFDDFTVDLNLDSEDPTKSMILVSIDPASVITGSAIFKDHLTSADWLDVAQFPEITFQSTTITANDDETYTVNGDLTVKGEIKPVTLNVTINAAMNHPMSGKPVVGIDATGELIRSDFGLGNYAPNVSDEMSLNITAELNKVQ
ncbi:YceI family protein [Granulosicoccus antarcticus]|uniref:Protein YceI n=1 Tax=Granulosicoccus antarcticus IMCC3135 TaxID=1192854 RepID=A0A2Z2P018_9GAMM|nr:YceI family protein [Granulosicoccus antarcticus]ASJ72724.1 Protein YceI [Granulosicoccus antarcticus IMCC3135]